MKFRRSSGIWSVLREESEGVTSTSEPNYLPPLNSVNNQVQGVTLHVGQ